MKRKNRDTGEVTEYIIRKNRCGFCGTNDHHLCPREVSWFSKVWICSCDCNKETTEKYMDVIRQQTPVLDEDEEPNTSEDEAV